MLPRKVWPLATGSNINDSFLGFWLQGVHLSQGLQAPERQPKEVRQGPGAPGGSSQGPNSTLPSPSPGDYRRGARHREDLS